jgi:hypothetical protein
MFVLSFREYVPAPGSRRGLRLSETLLPEAGQRRA